MIKNKENEALKLANGFIAAANYYDIPINDLIQEGEKIFKEITENRVKSLTQDIKAVLDEECVDDITLRQIKIAVDKIDIEICYKPFMALKMAFLYANIEFSQRNTNPN